MGKRVDKMKFRSKKELSIKAQKLLLQAFEYDVDKEGYIIDLKTGKRHLCPYRKEPVLLKEASFLHDPNRLNDRMLVTHGDALTIAEYLGDCDEEQEYTKEEKSLMLYFEDCLVNKKGRITKGRMNDEESKIAKGLANEDLIHFGRLPPKTIERHAKVYRQGFPDNPTNFVRFTDEAWELAHKWRRERSERMIAKIRGRELNVIKEIVGKQK